MQSLCVCVCSNRMLTIVAPQTKETCSFSVRDANIHIHRDRCYSLLHTHVTTHTFTKYSESHLKYEIHGYSVKLAEYIYTFTMLYCSMHDALYCIRYPVYGERMRYTRIYLCDWLYELLYGRPILWWIWMAFLFCMLRVTAFSIRRVVWRPLLYGCVSVVRMLWNM